MFKLKMLFNFLKTGYTLLPMTHSNVLINSNLLVRPKMIVFGRTYVLLQTFFYFFSPLVKSPRCVGRPAWNFARWSV